MTTYNVSPTKVYLISYDNGQSYEEHHREPLFLVPSHEEAQRIISVSKGWIDTARAQAPESHYDVYNREGTEEEQDAAEKAFKAYIARLVVPFGIDELKSAVGPLRDEYGKLVMTELDYWTPAFSSAIPSVPTSS